MKPSIFYTLLILSIMLCTACGKAPPSVASKIHCTSLAVEYTSISYSDNTRQNTATLHETTDRTSTNSDPYGVVQVTAENGTIWTFSPLPDGRAKIVTNAGLTAEFNKENCQ